MDMEWDNDFTLDFLIMYRGEPVIWDPTNAFHKRRDMVKSAWTRLSERSGKPIIELKKKKDSLMATFRGHLRRKKATIKAGAIGDEIYKPVWFAFEFMEEFLSHCTLDTNDDSSSNASEERVRREKIANVSFKLSPYNKIEEPSTSEDESNAIVTRASSVSQRKRQRRYQNLDESPETMNDMDFDVRVRTPSPSSPQQRKQRYIVNPLELLEPGSQMDDSYPTMLHNMSSKKDDRNEDDDCDLYGKMLAKKLRNLPEFERILLMHDIDGIVINALHRQQASPRRIMSPRGASKCTRPASTQSSQSV